MLDPEPADSPDWTPGGAPQPPSQPTAPALPIGWSRAGRAPLKFQALPCPICGGRDFEAGVIKASGYWLAFRGFGPTPLFHRSTQVQARRCLTCANVQLFAAPQR
jgi:hypothetical protein